MEIPDSGPALRRQDLFFISKIAFKRAVRRVTMTKFMMAIKLDIEITDGGKTSRKNNRSFDQQIKL